MIRNLWQQLFARFLKKYHLSQYFLKTASLKDLHHSSYAQQVGKQLSQQLKQSAQLTPDQLYSKLSSHRQGLIEQEASERREHYGLNEVHGEKPLQWWQHLWYCYKNPFNILLTILAIVAALTHDYEGTAIIVVMVLLSTLLRFWQESKSNKAADALKSMVSNRASVYRRDLSYKQLTEIAERYAVELKHHQGHLFEIPTKYLVPGDLIQLSAGDMVPADCRIVFAKDLFVSQARR